MLYRGCLEVELSCPVADGMGPKLSGEIVEELQLVRAPVVSWRNRVEE